MNSNSNDIPKDLIAIANIVKPKGLKGELKLFLYNKDSKTLTKNINVWIKLDDEYQNLKIEYLISSGKYKVIKFEGLSSRNESECLSNKTIYVSRVDFNNAQDVHLVDLIGFMIKDEFEVEYGIITDIINLPTNNSLIFSYEGKEIMIPISNDFIELFDFENKVVIVKNSDVFINKC